MARLLAAAALLASVSAHSTKYPALGDVNCTGPPAVLSYHIHIVFSLTSDVQIAAAIALRDLARKAFAPYTGDDCPSRYDNG